MNRPLTAKQYTCFDDLTKSQVRGKDFVIRVNMRASRVAVIAPHAGGIEPGTSYVAQAIAGSDLDLYLFEGIRKCNNYKYLHLTSHRFDEPECIKLISSCPVVVAIHGCKGSEEKVLLGGLDDSLKSQLAQAIQAVGVAAELDGHPYPARNENNICNRGRSKRGVQLELTFALRASGAVKDVIAAVRKTLADGGTRA